MERLTSRNEDCVQINGHALAYATKCELVQMAERLAAYEDTEPGRLRELAEADKAGRCVVLPCKPGEHVFTTGTLKIVECKVEAIYKDKRNSVVCVTFDCDSDCYGCPFYDPLPDPEGDFRCEGELREAEISFDAFGKTVFFTREEAERAMEGGKDG